MENVEKKPNPIFSPVLKKSVIGFLIFLAVCGLGILIMDEFPVNVIRINPIGSAVSSVFATIFIILCLVGIVSIFKKSLRGGLVLVGGALLLLLLLAACLNLFVEKISYRTAKNMEPVERLVVVSDRQYSQQEIKELKKKKDFFGYEEEVIETKTREDYSVTFRFLDDDHEESVSNSKAFGYYKQFRKGDTCVAYVRDGSFGIKFITDIKLKARKSVPVVADEEEAAEEESTEADAAEEGSGEE